MRDDEETSTDGQGLPSEGGGSEIPRSGLPRDRAGSMDFPPEGGAIKGALSLGDFMEVYAARATYRVKGPDSLDPKRTISNMPWSKSTVAPVGASNPIVARIVIQLVNALDNWPLRNGDSEAIKRCLHACKEETLICEAAYNRLKVHYDAGIACIKEGRLKIERNVVECPSIPGLRDESVVFLTSAKRSLQCVGEVFNQFYVPDGSKPMVANANFEFAINRLEIFQPVDTDFVDYLRNVVPITKHFVELRNGLEHPTDNNSTVIEDFRLTPQGIATPSWRRGNLVEDSSVIDDMAFFPDFQICFCENIFFSGLLDNLPTHLPVPAAVCEVPEDQVDPECPVRYRLG